MIQSTFTYPFQAMYSSQKQRQSAGSWYAYLCDGMGQRSVLLSVLILTAGVLVTVQLDMAMQGRALYYHWMMRGMMAIMWILLIWRLRSTDRLLLRVVCKTYRLSPDAKARLKSFSRELHLDERTQNRLQSLIRWMPRTFVDLLLVLTVMNIVLRLVHWSGALASHALPNMVFPWGVFFLCAAYLLYNDIRIGYTLNAVVMQMLPANSMKEQPVNEQPAPAVVLRQHRQLFLKKLSRRQREVARLRFGEGKALAEIAQELYICKDTVKTHINDLLKVWKQYHQEHQPGDISIRDLMEQDFGDA